MPKSFLELPGYQNVLQVYWKCGEVAIGTTRECPSLLNNARNCCSRFVIDKIAECNSKSARRLRRLCKLISLKVSPNGEMSLMRAHDRGATLWAGPLESARRFYEADAVSSYGAGAFDIVESLTQKSLPTEVIEQLDKLDFVQRTHRTRT